MAVDTKHAEIRTSTNNPGIQACHLQRELQNLDLRENCKYYDALTFLRYKSTPEALDLCSSAPSQGDQPVAAHPQTS